MDTGSYSVRRIRWDEFEIEYNGIRVSVKRGDLVKGCPRCFHIIEELYPAMKAAHGVQADRNAREISL